MTKYTMDIEEEDDDNSDTWIYFYPNGCGDDLFYLGFYDRLVNEVMEN